MLIGVCQGEICTISTKRWHESHVGKVKPHPPTPTRAGVWGGLRRLGGKKEWRWREGADGSQFCAGQRQGPNRFSQGKRQQEVGAWPAGLGCRAQCRGVQAYLGTEQRDVWASTADTPRVPVTPLLILNPRSQGWKTMRHFFLRGEGALPMQRGFYLFFKMFHLSIYSFLYLLGFTRFELRSEGSFSCSVYNLVS